MKFIVTDSVTGETIEVDAKTPKQAVIKALKYDTTEGNVDLECVWDITVNRKHPRKSKD